MGVVKLGDVARESRLKWTKSKQDVPIVGLEHLIPDEIRFDAYDINTDNTFSKRFVKGQVLFGRRRAYQRKAAIAEFDGICSGDITVIQAIEGKMLPELLPFIIQTPVFFDYANLKRPMLFFTYDLDKYRDVLRGFYIDMEKELPGPLVYSTKEVIDQIKHLDEMNQKYAQRYEVFYDKFCSIDDGNASQRAVEAVFK